MSPAPQLKKREDQRMEANGQRVWLWALEVPSNEGQQVLVAMYDLPSTLPLIRHREGVTHEVTVFPICSETGFDFDQSLFTQKQVKVLKPEIGFQLTRDSDDDAVKSVIEVIEKIQAGKLDATGEDIGPWADEFEDDVSLIAALPEPESRVENDRSAAAE